MEKKQKLELTWIGKDKRPRLEPRVLVEDVEKSHHATTRRKDGKDIFDNMLIHGDNLLALKALEQQFTGKVKCIYIDPPYNTGSAFTHYDDGLEHSIWLGLMRERLELLWRLLSPEGSMWISIDQDEEAYLKVLCDEIFGRESFVSSMVWQKRTSPDMRSVISDAHDFVLLYAKERERFKAVRNRLPLSEEQSTNYTNRDNDPRGPWGSVDITGQVGHATASQFYEIITPIGKKMKPPHGRCWALAEATFKDLVADNRIWFGDDGASRPRKKVFLSESKGVTPWTWWTNKEVGHNQEAKKEVNAIFGSENAFDTPKPERLIHRIIHIATNPGDLVLDSFLGSGTTAAVAHKMGRRWIGVELGDHCYTHCKVRLDKVIDGEDAGGITKAVGWKGGGGYRFFELAPTLITKDKWGQEVINKDYNPAMLAEAVCKLEGYTYAPSETEYFIHGHSTEKSFIYVTTNFIRKAELDDISEQVGGKRSLLICCKGFDRGASCANIRLKKIPEALLKKCEWGHDDYSLNVANLPMAQGELEQGELFGEG